MSNTPLPEPVYHQWRKKKMPWSLEFAFNSMCHVTTDDSEIRTLHTADQMHAHAAAVSAAKDARIKVLEEQLAVAAMQLINAIGYIEEARAALGDKNG